MCLTGKIFLQTLVAMFVRSFSVALRPQRPWGLLGRRFPGRLPPLSHSSWALLRPAAQCRNGLLGMGANTTPTSTFTQLLSSAEAVQCRSTSTETVRTVREEVPRTASSTFTQLLSSAEAVQCRSTSTETVRTVKGWDAHDGHLDIHTAPELCWGCSNVALRPQRP